MADVLSSARLFNNFWWCFPKMPFPTFPRRFAPSVKYFWRCIAQPRLGRCGSENKSAHSRIRSSARNSSFCLAFNKKTDIDRGAAEYFRVANIKRLPATLPFPDMRRLTQALQGASCDKKGRKQPRPFGIQPTGTTDLFKHSAAVGDRGRIYKSALR